MALLDYRADMERCCRCSYCKFVPFLKIRNHRFDNICPSIAKYSFHAYSAGGRFITALSLVRGRIDYSDKLLDIIYQCQMDGGCDVSCKNQRDLEPLEAMLELRAKCVEDGQLLPAHMVVIDGLKKEDNMLQAKKTDRGNWAKGLDVKDLAKEKAEVLFHAGCRLCFDEELWAVARGAVRLLRKAEVDVGIMGKEETCCGGRAYELGYQGELTKYAEHNIQTWQSLGIKQVVTSCACCYHTFKVLYDKIGKEAAKIEVLHITEYLDRLLKDGMLKLTKELPIKATYHDPCHLGRLAEPWIHWEGEEVKVMGQLILQDPPKEFRRGAKGVYDPPREILRRITSLEFVEMDRIREYAWCCGAGGGVQEAYPDFAVWTAKERIEEAGTTGAQAIVTACPWCERNFKDAVHANGYKMEIYDITELLLKAM